MTLLTSKLGCYCALAAAIFSAIFYTTRNLDMASEQQAHQHLSDPKGYIINTNVRLSKLYDLKLRGQALALAWSHNSKYLATASGYGTELSVFDRKGNSLGSVRRNGMALDSSIVCLDDGKVLFGSSMSENQSSFLSVWDVKLGKSVFDFSGPGLATVFDISPDGATLAVELARTSVEPRGEHRVGIYNIKDWRAMGFVKVPEGLSVIRFLERDAGLVFGSFVGNLFLADGKLQGISLRATPFSGVLPTGGSVRGAIGSLAISPDGQMALVGQGLKEDGIGLGAHSRSNQPGENRIFKAGRSVQLLALPSGLKVAEFMDAVVSPIRSAVWDQKGRFVVFSDNNKHIYFWDSCSSRGQPTRLDTDQKVTPLAVSQDGTRLAVATNDGAAVFEIQSHLRN